MTGTGPGRGYNAIAITSECRTCRVIRGCSPAEPGVYEGFCELMLPAVLDRLHVSFPYKRSYLIERESVDGRSQPLICSAVNLCVCHAIWWFRCYVLLGEFVPKALHLIDM